MPVLGPYSPLSAPISHFPEARVIEGRLTVLRAIEPEDLDALWRWQNDPEVMYYWAEPYSVVSREELASRYQAGLGGPTGGAHWLLIATHAGQPIGRIGYV